MRKAIIMAGLIGSILALFGCGKSEKATYEVAEVYSELRQQMLNMTPETIGFDASPSNRVLAVLMETGYPEAVFTLATVADGTVSLYFSNGGGMLGLGEHERPRRAGLALLSAVPQFLQHAKPTKVFPLPEEGHTRFYFVTDGGVFTADALEDDLGNDQLPLSPLFHKAQAVITEARLVSENTEAE